MEKIEDAKPKKEPKVRPLVDNQVLSDSLYCDSERFNTSVNEANQETEQEQILDMQKTNENLP